MFPTDEFLKGAFFGAVIGGIITVVLLKLWEKKGAAPTELKNDSACSFARAEKLGKNGKTT